MMGGGGQSGIPRGSGPASARDPVASASWTRPAPTEDLRLPRALRQSLLGAPAHPAIRPEGEL